MKRLLFVLLVLLLAKEHAAQPKLTFEKTSVYYRYFDKDSTPTIRFKIYNTGNEPLQIWSAHSSRVQDEIDFNQNEILPSDSAYVAVKLRMPIRLKVEGKLYLTNNSGHSSNATYSGRSNDSSGPRIRFSNSVFSFDTVYERQRIVQASYTYVNTGDEPLILKNVKSSCGCLTTRWSKEPLPPGDTGVIYATLSVAGRFGVTHKSITCVSNAVDTPIKVIRIKGIILHAPTQIGSIHLSKSISSDSVIFQFKRFSNSDTLFIQFLNLPTGKLQTLELTVEANQTLFPGFNYHSDWSSPHVYVYAEIANDTCHYQWKNSFSSGDSVLLLGYIRNRRFEGHHFDPSRQSIRLAVFNYIGNQGYLEQCFRLPCNATKPVYIKITSNLTDDLKAKSIKVKKQRQSVDEYHFRKGKLRRVSTHSLN